LNQYLKKLKRILLCIFSALNFLALHAQQYKYPQGYFRNPLNIPIQLAANFGELRPDHFHMGLDIRTQSKENLPVFACADGYVSHIRIEKNGYGRAIFIVHPNGYTTVYGHLNKFFDALEEYVKEKQYKDEKWQQDFSMPAGMFPVVRGQFIANSGNTGASQGPHLHFEIRDTKTGNNLNPVLFGFDIPDDIPPAIYSLHWYDRQHGVYGVIPQTIPINYKNDFYTTKDSIVKVGSPVISLGIRMEDLNNTSPFRYGVYRASLFLDDSLLFEFSLDNFLYENSRYINACMDYAKWINGRQGIQHLCILPGNQLNIFSATGTDGKIVLNDTLVHAVQIDISDENYNTSSISFLVQHNDSLRNNYTSPANTIVCAPKKQNRIESKHAKLHFDENAFYDTVPFAISETEFSPANQVSPTIHAGSYLIPVHSMYDISIELTKPIADSLKDKVVMQLFSGNSKSIATGEWQSSWLAGSFDEFGDVRLLLDTIPPAISTVGWKTGAIFKGKKTLTVKCTDDVSRIESFRAELDGNWLMFSKRNDYFIYTFDEHCSAGAHELKIVSTDVAGNSATGIFNFIKQE
jgi:hypothetical protein